LRTQRLKYNNFDSIIITLAERRNIKSEEIIDLYRANEWSAADKPVELCNALSNSHSLITAWDNERLIGLGNAISDGHLVVYYPHLLVNRQHNLDIIQ